MPANCSPERRLLVVALSGRACAYAAWRAGFRPVVLDLFGDADLRAIAAASAVVPGDLAAGFDPAALLAAAGRMAPAGSVEGVLYGSGLEDAPELIRALATGRRLYGNTEETVRRVKDPEVFFPVLDRLGLPRPRFTFDSPADPASWLAKRAGGAGGGHVRAAMCEPAGGGTYFQGRVGGAPHALLFAADGKRGRMLSWSSQWPDPAPGAPFRFGGAVGPVLVPDAVGTQIGRALDALVCAFGLRGLNSLDLLENGAKGFHVLEVNPRPGAALDVFDGPGLGSLGAVHLAACAGALDHPWVAPAAARAMHVVYATAAGVVPVGLVWPGWVADRPAPGARIEPGAPVCTVRATAADAPPARALVAERRAWVLRQLTSLSPDRPS
ncbi:MAG: ATP-grasp domain-containing protein [Acetobacteraceae bacterium]